MSRFGNKGKSSRGSSRGGSSRGEGRGASRGGGRSSGGRGKSRRRDNDGGGFIKVGDLHPTKKMDDETIDDLRESDLRMMFSVYLPEGEKLTLRKGDKLFVHVGNFHPEAPDYVLGTVSAFSDED